MVEVAMDRPMGSKHPKCGYTYPINYGYIPGTLSGDGEELDAYVLGAQEPLEKFSGKCIAAIKRLDEDDDKLIVVPAGARFTEAEIEAAVEFQEQWFRHKLIMSE